MQQTMDNGGDIRSWMSAWWLLLALSAELGALACAFMGANALGLGLHALSALGFGGWAADGRVMSRPGPFMAACVFVLTVPIVGAIGVALLIVPAWRALRPAHDDGVIEIDLPHAGMASHAQDAVASLKIAPAPIEVVLRTQGAAQKRVSSVMALRRMDAQHAVPLLRVALSDPSEDVRLLAYAILERREKELRGRIDTLLSELAEQPVPSSTVAQVKLRAATLKALSEQHWELVHGGFVSGDVEKQTLEEAVRHGHESLLLASDGSLSLLLARVRLRQHKAVSALRYLRAADSLGVANAVLAPLYAEVAFLMRRFDAVGPLLAEAGRAPLARPKLDAVARFWTERERA